jgi:aryl sulfotransferase
MQRIADFLEIKVPKEIWPVLLQAAGIETMRKQGAALMPNVTRLFEKGAETFFNKGTNGRWKGVFRADDLELYNAKIARHFSPDCAAWHANGRLAAGVGIHL